MAPGGGLSAVDTMIKTLRNNSKLLRKNRAFDKIKDRNDALAGRTYVNSKTATLEQLAELRAKTLADNKRQLVRQIVRIVGSIILIAALVAIFIYGAFHKGG